MAKDIKKEILATAEKLFLEKRYDDVSMREIADALGVSVGNLTYHFKKKEELAEAVICELLNNRKPYLSCHSLEELHAWIVAFEKDGKIDTFYFKDFMKLLWTSKTVRQIQREAFKENLLFWQQTLQALCAAGLMQPEGFQGQQEAFIHNLYSLRANWNEQSLIETKLGIKKTKFRFRAWALIFPMLTDKGKRLFNEKIKP